MNQPRATASRIAIIFHDFSPGGTERIAIRLAGAWAAMGRQVTIFCGTEEGPLRRLVAPQVDVIEISPAIRRSPLSRFRLGRAAAALVDRYSPDIVFAPGNFHLPVLAVLVGRLQRCRPGSVVKISNPLCKQGRRGWRAGLFKMVTRFLARRMSAFVAMSASLAEEAQAVLTQSRIVPIAEPNLDEAGQIPGSLAGVSTSPLIVTAGRFVPQKDFTLAIQSFAALGEASTARLAMLGDGVERTRIEALARRWRLADRVTFAGFVPNIRPFLDGARLLLLTSRFEGYPAVVIEALAAGVPVVATDCSPALHELITDADFGEIVADRSPEAIAAAIHRQLARPMPAFGKLTDSVRHNALRPSALAYLELFDSVHECLHGAAHRPGANAINANSHGTAPLPIGD